MAKLSSQTLWCWGKYSRNKEILGFDMTSQRTIPDAQTRAQNVARLREVNLRLDALILETDHLIAMAEAEKLKNPVTLHRLRKYLNPAIVESIQKVP
ncbi:MAG: hypothetical protein HC852_11665 [Acaryochloridaceae cyanobacterium RU_4_10]|nr:hypothetical protein [Acaryochloridaceae cyanobacterium RU_4_10]